MNKTLFLTLPGDLIHLIMERKWINSLKFNDIGIDEKKNFIRIDPSNLIKYAELKANNVPDLQILKWLAEVIVITFPKYKGSRIMLFFGMRGEIYDDINDRVFL